MLIVMISALARHRAPQTHVLEAIGVGRNPTVVLELRGSTVVRARERHGQSRTVVTITNTHTHIHWIVNDGIIRTCKATNDMPSVVEWVKCYVLLWFP